MGSLFCGCEDNGRSDYNQNQYYNDGYNNYNSETYVNVEVRNDYWGFISIYTGHAEYDQVEPGGIRSVSRSLIGNEKFRISIWFFDQSGNAFAKSGEYSFDRDYTEYHMNVRSPENIEVK